MGVSAVSYPIVHVWFSGSVMVASWKKSGSYVNDVVTASWVPASGVRPCTTHVITMVALRDLHQVLGRTSQ